jgi:hypothetical protein
MSCGELRGALHKPLLALDDTFQNLIRMPGMRGTELAEMCVSDGPTLAVLPGYGFRRVDGIRRPYGRTAPSLEGELDFFWRIP